MKHIIRKAYFDFEKEEKWLNEMALKGMALTDYSWCRYVFEDVTPGQYIYRIELLENLPTHPESLTYIRFMEETGAECVSTYQRWVYFRKKAEDGAFDIYSDIDSRIKHYKRICQLWLSLACLELIIGFANLVIGTVNFILKTPISGINIGFGIPLISMGIAFLVYLCLPVNKKVRQLKQEQLVRE